MYNSGIATLLKEVEMYLLSTSQQIHDRKSYGASKILLQEPAPLRSLI
jgi:hypothetical protein